MAVNVRESIVFPDPATVEERSTRAESCVRKLGIRIPALVDDVADGVEAAYTGWPDRLYVIARNGRIAYKSQPGPFGFEPEPMEKALRQTLAEATSPQPGAPAQ